MESILESQLSDIVSELRFEDILQPQELAFFKEVIVPGVKELLSEEQIAATFNKLSIGIQRETILRCILMKMHKWSKSIGVQNNEEDEENQG